MLLLSGTKWKEGLNQLGEVSQKLWNFETDAMRN